jgi:hypothetical protein
MELEILSRRAGERERGESKLRQICLQHTLIVSEAGEEEHDRSRSIVLD